jgi:sulfur relay (sulfurtransferase) complex TusBCD TusD component (DsrE family)
MQSIDKLNEIQKFKPNYVIEAIRIALKDSTACCEDSDDKITIFIFLYKDGSQLTIDTMGYVKALNTNFEYWVY